MVRRSFAFVAALMLLLISAGTMSYRPATAVAAPLSQGDASVTVTVPSEHPVMTERIEAGQRYITFEKSSSALNGPGTPALPAEQRFIAIPAGVTPHLAVTSAAPVELPQADAPFLPVPTMRLPEGVAIEEVDQVEGVYEMRDDIATTEWYPATPVRLSDPMTVRGQTMVRLEYTTVQVNLATGEARWLPEIEATVSWAMADAQLPSAPSSDPTYDAVLDQMVVNPDQARAWRLPTGGASKEQLVNPEWRVTVQNKGLYRIPLNSMAGVNAANASRLAVYYGPLDAPVEQAVWVNGDSLYLVNTREPGFWSNDIVYRIQLLPVGQGGIRMNPLPSDPVGDVYKIFLPLVALNGSSGTSSPLLVPEAPAAPDVTWTTSVPYDLRVEQNRIYNATEAATRPDERWHWFSLAVTASLPQIESPLLSFDAPNHDRAAGVPVTVRSELGPLYVGGSQCRTVTVTVNGSYTQSRTWTGNTTGFNSVVTLPASALTATGNTYRYRINLCPNYMNDRILLNAFIVRYQRFLQATNDQFMFDNPGDLARVYATSGFNGSDIQGFEVGTLNQPRVITGGQASGDLYRFGRPAAAESYLVARLGGVPTLTPTPYVPSGLRNNTTHADYIIISPAEFQGALGPLVTHIQNTRGQTVRQVKTTDIYNDFGVGTLDPQAIRYFLEFAYRSWATPAPSYVLLVGDGNYDPRNFLGNSPPNYLPPYLIHADASLGEVPADNGFVSDLAIGSTDNLPDMHVGRLPAASVAHVTTMVTKIVGYENSAPAGNWRREVTFAADDADNAGNFPAYSDALVPYIRASTTATLLRKIYLPSGASSSQILGARDSLVGELNDGELILQYVGHAGATQWVSGAGGMWSVRRAATGYGDLDLLSTAIGYRQPVNLPWACWDGYFVFPEEGNQATSEVMVRTYTNRGSIASFSPTGLDLASAHDLLAQGFLQGLYGTGSPPNTPQTEIGPLTLLAKLRVAGTSYARLIDTYLLIGEPGMDIARDPCVLNGTCPNVP